MPYFGIAFYRDDTKIPQLQLVDEIIGALGKEYVSSPSKSGLIFIGKSKVKRFDSEGDPRNLCKFPRKHRLIVPQLGLEESQDAAYTLLANVANLCKFGDRMASRLF